MSIKKLNPYITFNGTAEKAIKFYEKALGAKLENLMRFGDVTAPGPVTAPAHKDRVMHAVVRIGDGLLMVSDNMPDSPVPTGGNVQITLEFDDPADLAKRFDALAAGGKVTLPVQDMFWGAKFGMLTDAFAVQWMFNCEIKKA